MVLKDNAELANVVSRALMDYANRVQNGLVTPYRNLLESNMAVVVLTVTDAGAVSVIPIPESKQASTTDETEVLAPEAAVEVVSKEDAELASEVEEVIVKPESKRSRRKRIIEETTE